MQGTFLQQREYLMSQGNESHRRCIVQGELGDDYVLYLLEDQEEKPVAVVLPKDAAEQPLSAAQEVSSCLPEYPDHLPMLPKSPAHAFVVSSGQCLRVLPG